VKIGFIGLGHMGQGIARNILKAGHEVTVYNRSRGPAEQLAGDGARLAASADEACRGDVVVSMLADDAALDQVLIESGVIARLPASAIHICMATISIAMARRLAELHVRHGSAYVSAPCFGRPAAAAAAQLTIVAAGPAQAMARVRPLLNALGPNIFEFGGDAYLANVVKLSGNFFIASVIETMGEAFALTRKHGISPDAYFEFFRSIFDCRPVRAYGEIITQGKYEPAGFRLLLGLKDLNLVLAAGGEVNVALPVASLVRDHMLSGIARGCGEMDWSVIAELSAQDAGLTART